MPRKLQGRRRPQAKQDNGPAKNKSGKQVALDLASKAGKGLIKGLLPAVVAAATKAIGAIVPGPHAAISQYGSPVSLPASVGSMVRTGNPRTTTSGNGNMNVKHREYVCDIGVRMEGFDLQFQFGLNPGNSGLFPWLSTVAQRFEMYKFRSVKVIYEPQTSTTSTGTLMLAVDYDASDPPPVDKTMMMSYKNAVRSPLWSGCSHVSASGDLHRLKTNYVLSGVAPPDTDIKTYDIGNLFIALQSDNTDIAAGEIYVEYDVDLITPQITPIVNSASIIADLSSITLANPLGNAPQVIGSLPISIVDVTLAGSTDPVQYLWIQSAGYFVISLVSFNVPIFQSFTDVGFNPTNVQLLVDSVGTFEAEGGDHYVGFIMVQIINTLEPQIVVGSTSGTLGSNPACFVAITPIGADAIPNPDLSGVSSSIRNPRARLGRLNYIDPSSSALSLRTKGIPVQNVFKKKREQSLAESSQTTATSKGRPQIRSLRASTTQEKQEFPLVIEPQDECT